MRKDIIENVDTILNFINDGYSKSKICKHFSCKPETLNSYLNKLGIEYGGNQSGKGTDKNKKLRKSSNFYLNDINFISSHKLKNKLIEDGIKEHKCECCGLSKWLGENIPIELHHVDGNRFNNYLSNLQILCPNCHSKTDNNSGKSARKIK